MLFAKFMTVYYDVFFCLSACLTPFMVYLLIYQSRKIGKYRWYMLNNFICDFVYDCILELLKPYFVPVSVGGYSLAWIRWSTTSAYTLFEIGVTFLEFTCISVILSLLYRYSQAFPGRIQIFFEHSKWIYLCYLCFYVMVVPTSVSPICLRRMTSEDQIKKFLWGNNAAYTSPANAMIAYKWSDTVKTVTWFMLLLLTIFFVLGTTLFVVAHVKITRGTGKHVVASRLQMMLYRACMVQYLVGLGFLLFPLVVMTIAMNCVPSKMDCVGNIVFMLTAAHSSVEYLVTIYFIKPYRRFLWGLLQKAMLHLGVGNRGLD
ncbi:hypothetical protein AAVH_14175 [Aphelenchoides avenae]|nr:hypothetical protein AAVH_14175 [Aphelenchus avenae]